MIVLILVSSASPNWLQLHLSRMHIARAGAGAVGTYNVVLYVMKGVRS